MGGFKAARMLGSQSWKDWLSNLSASSITWRKIKFARVLGIVAGLQKELNREGNAQGNEDAVKRILGSIERGPSIALGWQSKCRSD